MATVKTVTGRRRTITEQQKAFINARAKGMNPKQAATVAGYSTPHVQGYQMENVPHIRTELEKAWRKQEKMADVSKQKVIDGMLEAIEQAKLLADPSAQIGGWREIARMCGYYEPQRLQVEVSVSAKRLISQYEALSDEELLKLADETIIESTDFEVIDDAAEQ